MIYEWTFTDFDSKILVNVQIYDRSVFREFWKGVDIILTDISALCKVL